MRRGCKVKSNISRYYNKFWFIFIVYFCVINIAIIWGVWYIIFSDRAEAVAYLEENSKDNIRSLDLEISILFDSIKADLLFLPKLNEVIRYNKMPNEEDRRSLGKEFSAFVTTKKIYDQIRYIDKSGMEVVRINYNQGEGEIVPQEKLQNKADRYYFKETMALKKGAIYISPLDLNIEQKKIELPHKPMIRFGIQVYQENGEIKGVIILNYLAENIIDKIKSFSTEEDGEFYLINRKGYYLYHIDEGKEWGFMYLDREKYTIRNEYPEIWEVMNDLSSTQYMAGDLIVSYMPVKPLDSVSDTAHAPEWTLLNIVNLARLSLAKEQEYYKIVGYALFSAVFVLILSIVLARLTIQRNRFQSELRHSALFDTLTDLPNRKQLFINLDQVMKDSRRRRFNYALLFVDLDNFKIVNDTKGHKAGDQVLKIAAKRMKAGVRECDTVARVGGDEFVIILSYFEQVSACVKIAQKILARLCEEIVLDDDEGVVTVGASIGVAVAGPDTYDSVDEILQRADDLMYEVKKSGKNSIWVDDSAIT